MLLLFLPHLLAIAAAILVKSGRPVVYMHWRVGRSGRRFPCLKFRTMVRDADHALDTLLKSDPEARRQWYACRKLDQDPRIIAGVGNFLRRTSLDELPQILNVLRGDMSLVGPRPVTVEELTDHYGQRRIAYQSVRPGLTGIWQISGRSDTCYVQRVRMDTWYASNASLRVDLWVLWRTMTDFLSGRLSGAR
ncbi:sugar transferase [Jannaschia sp. W003]|uniref:sugar transferase n=1 Tax=Jannaschia sp. W003 TaxID=2867012 RepID=UPI0021A68EED|nr:sugar transferase [Jannaschia sp. W003]